jgi:N-acyl-D-aspartate/D-glutamate deacylase
VLIGLNLAPQGVPVASTQQPASDPENISSSIRPAALRDAEYRKQRDQLIVEVQDRLQAMPEAERAKVAASLNTLKRSIQEIEAALGRDPANALLQELLVSSCQEEMRALTAVRDAGRQEI